MDDGTDVTRWLAGWRAGDEGARERLFEALYAHLRRLARAQLARERVDHTLQPTALVHEAWIDLARERNEPNDRAHFLAIAATAMRRVLVDHAVKRGAVKRGGGAKRVELRDVGQPEAEREDWIEIDVALEKLAGFDARKARVVELRFFGGLEQKDVALVLGVSERTVEREWRLARAWLAKEIGERAAKDETTRSGPSSPRTVR